MRSRSVLTLLAATFAAVTATAAVRPVAHAAPADPPRYVALGDSYSSGVGAGPTEGDCRRSPAAYPQQLANRFGLRLDQRSCSGATAPEVARDQLDALDAGTAYVTLTAGGNDLGFSRVLGACAAPWWVADCGAAVDLGRQALERVLPTRLESLNGEISRRAPRAQVVVTGYPRLFAGETCLDSLFVSVSEQEDLNRATDELNAVVARAARASGHRYADPVPEFTGHAVCDAEPWVNGLVLPPVEAFHPNRAGQLGYERVVAAAVTGAARWKGKPVDPAPAPVEDDGMRAAADRVLMMRLDAPANLERAESAGVDPEQVRRSVERLRSSDPDAVLAGLTELQAVDALGPAGEDRAGLGGR